MLDMAAALAVAYLENLDIAEAIEKLKTFQSLAGRGEAFSGKNFSGQDYTCYRQKPTMQIRFL